MSLKVAVLEVSDLTKVYGDNTPLTVRLLENGTPLAGKTLTFNIHGVDYTRTTHDDGYTSLNISLGVGAYSTKVTFNSDNTYEPITKTVMVRVVEKPKIDLRVDNLVKTYDTADQLIATIPGQEGLEVLFTINGVTYSRHTDSEGKAKMNIKLQPGSYPVTVMYAGDSTYAETVKKVNVTVKSNTWIDGFKVDKKFSDPGYYQCAVYDLFGRLNPCSVDLTINGVTYTRKTEGDGLIKLNIKLQPGEYTINVRYNGDNLHNPSSRSDLVVVHPDIEELNVKTSTGVVIPIDNHNQGHVQTHIYSVRMNPETAKANRYTFDLLPWDEVQQNGTNDMNFESFEIDETDPRVKTARVTTDKYFDLTDGRRWIFIASPVHENFGGRILDVDYNKDTGLYTYQCQDGRRQYMSKSRLRYNNVEVYSILETILVRAVISKGTVPLPLTQDYRDRYANVLSGLQPIENYYMKMSPIMTPDNVMKRKITGLSYDRLIDRIMNIAHTNGQCTDVYFTPDGICHIDPVNLDEWLTSGIRLTHQDLVSYKYGFNITNIITGVTVKDPNQNVSYHDWGDLIFYFGSNNSMIDPVTTQVQGEATTTSNSNTVSTGVMSGQKSFIVGCDGGGGGTSSINKVISALQSKGHSASSVGVGDSVVQNYGLTSSSKGKIAVFICNGICAGTIKDFVDGMSRGYYHYDHAIFLFENCTTDNWISCTAIRRNKQVRAHDDHFSTGIDTSITFHEMFEKHSNLIHYVAGQPNESLDSLVTKLVNGELNCSGVSNASASTTSTSGSSTTVIDETATYNKALEEVTKSVRDLLSFTIRVPLNNPVFKKLHTNMLLWTELPKEFVLANLGDVFKIMGSWKQSRGVPYVENRWYVERVKIKGDKNGVFADITLNPFPSSYSSYANAVRAYAEAYDQAFNQQNTTTTTTVNPISTLNEPRLGNDALDTGSMAAATGRYRGRAGDNENFDNAALKGYAVKDANYYTWARQYKTPIELAKALANRFSYVPYSNNKHGNARVTHNNGGTIACNCYDAARYVKCCFDSCGFDCVVITGTIYEGGHAWNAVKHNGRWYSFDLCYWVTGKEWQGTNSLRLASEW